MGTGIVLSPVTPVGTVTAAGPVTDDFSGGYSGGTGWNADWNESGDDGNPATGSMRIDAGALRFQNLDGDSIGRDLDLSPFAPGAQVSFDVVGRSGNESVGVSFWNGSSFVAAGTTGTAPGGTRLTYTIPTDTLISGGSLRWSSDSGGWGSDEYVAIDNLSITDGQSNPDLAPGCGIDVVLILDESGSIGSTFDQDVEAATRAFVASLNGTGSRLRIVEFSNNARGADIGGSTDFQLVDDGLVTAVETYLTPSNDNAQDPSSYDPGSGEVYTNWEAGLYQASLNPGDLVVFMTDGVPNTVGITGSSPNSNGGGSASSAAAAVQEINAIKASGSHLLGVGVGDASQQSNWELLYHTIEPVGADLWEGTGDLDMRVVDAIRAGNFSQLTNALRLIVYAQCAPSVSITKYDDAGTKLAGWEFTGTVDVDGGPNDTYEWVSPISEATPDDGTGFDVAQTATTDSGGTALFQWTPGSANDPQQWNSTFTFTETLPAGWTLPATQSDCEVSRLSLDDPFNVQLVVLDGPDAQGVVTFGFEENNAPFSIAKSDILTCDLVNQRPASIEIVKAGSGDGTASFPFEHDADGETAAPADASLELGDSTGPIPVPAGQQVTITEGAAPAGLTWNLTAVSCTDGAQLNVPGNPDTRSVTVTPAAGQDIVCTFTNNQSGKLLLDKIGTPAGDDTLIPFEHDVDGDLGGDPDLWTTIEDSAVDLGEVEPGVYTIRELVPSATPAWVLSNISCADDTAGSNTSGSQATSTDAIVTVGAGDTVTCSFTNDRNARIVIDKTALGGDGVFDFTVTGSSGVVLDDSIDTSAQDNSLVVEVPAGSYTVSEAAESGWQTLLAQSSCGNDQAIADNGGAKVSLTLAAGETRNCTFTNGKLGSITVEKSVTANDPTTGSFDFTLAPGSTETVAINGTYTWNALPEGDFTLSEAVTTGWALVDATCNGKAVANGGTIQLGWGDDVSCEFTNTKLATVIVEKQTLPDGSLQTFGFTGPDGSFELQDDGTTSFTVEPGTEVVVAEDAQSGWNLTDLSCSTEVTGDAVDDAVVDTSTDRTAKVTPGPGETVRCTFTNTQDGTIVVNKSSVGSASTFDYTSTIPGASTFSIVTTGSTPGPYNGQQTFAVAPGTYSVTEVIAPEAPWDLTSLVCVDPDQGSTPSAPSAGMTAQIDLDPGETVTCTYTNTQRASITVVKRTLNAQGEALEVAFPFTGDLGGFTLDVDPATVGVTDQELFANLLPNASYTIAESVPTGWTLTDVDCGDWKAGGLDTTVALSPGQSVTCVFTNTADPASVDITKTVVGAAVGEAWSFDFGISPVPANETSSKSVAHDGANTVGWTGLVPGAQYTVSEVGDAAYDSGALTCTGVTDLDPSPTAVEFVATTGMQLSCTITNSKRPTITVDKVTVPAADPTMFDFTENWTTPNGDTFQLADATAPKVSPTLTNGGTYTVAETPETGWSLTGISCVGTDVDNVVRTGPSVDITPEPGENVVCTFTNVERGDVNVEKTSTGPVTAIPGGYRVSYDVTVTSDSNLDEAFTLSDTPDFGSGATLTALGAVVNGGASTGTPPAVLGTFGLPGGDIATGTIGPDDVFVYTVTVDFTVDPGMTSVERTCVTTTDSPGKGAYNSATVEFGDADTNRSYDCEDIPTATIVSTKTVTSGPTYDAVAGDYTVTYEIDIENTGAGVGEYDLSDTPSFGAGTSISQIVVSSAQLAADIDPYTAGDPIATGTSIAAGASHTYTVTVTFTVSGTTTATARDCILGDGENGTGTLNTATVTWNGPTRNPTDCGELPDPDVGQTKSVVSADLVGGTWTIVYDVVVTNVGDGPGTYAVADELGYGAGVAVQTVDAEVLSTSGDATPPVDGDLNPAFDPDPDAVGFDPELVSGVDIAAGAVHTYRVTVTATIPNPVLGAGACDTAEGADGGFLNTATLTVNGVEQGPDRACAPFGTLTLVKDLVNDDGGNAVIGDFLLTAEPVGSDVAVVSGTGTVVEAVPAGAYDLAETEAAGYTASGWTCTVGDSVENIADGALVVIGEGQDVRCEITNDDEPVDLRLTKDDGGAFAVAGGAPFTYTITVENGGTRDADATEPVTVTDVLPDGLSWVSFPESGDVSCVQTDQTLTCDIDPALLGVDDPAVVIEATVSADADTPAGTYTNQAWVTTDDDPVCDDEGCVPPPCPTGEVALVEQSPNDNVDCEDTPVDNTSTLTIVKDDDVVDVEAGDSFDYTIAVTNNGPQPVDNVVVTDTVPAVLTVDSVSGTGWDCSATVGNAISCTRAAELAPSTIAPVITVAVTLDASFVGTSVQNTGVAVADVVKPDGFPAEKTSPVQDDVVTPVKSIDVSAFLPTCVADSPYIVVDIDAFGFDAAGKTVTLTFFDKNMNPLWVDADGNVVVGPVAGGTPYTTTVDVDGNPLQLTGQRVLFPGASLDPLDWPGWVLDGGIWVEDPSDDFLRDGVFIQVDINPTGLTGLIEYPPATSACADPEQTVADLAIVKEASTTNPVGAGNSFDWNLTITNNGPDPAVDVVVGDLVPTSLTVTGVASSDFECTRTGNDVTCTRSSLAVGASGTVTISVSVPAGATAGQITNVGTVESNVPDPDLSNNSDDASVTVVQQAVVTPTTNPPPVTLPRTGSDSTHTGIVVGLWLLAGGLLALGVTRRRRTRTTG